MLKIRRGNTVLRACGLLSLIGLLLFMLYIHGNAPAETLSNMATLSNNSNINPAISQIIIKKRLNEIQTDARTSIVSSPYKCISQIYYFENIHTSYTSIPKTGNSNWKEALLIAAKDIQEHSVTGQELGRNHAYSNRYKLKRLNLTMDSETIRGAFSFTVMRNPWTRMVSGYKDKLARNKSHDFFDPKRHD